MQNRTARAKQEKKFSFSSLHSVSLASTRSVLYPIQCPMTVMKTKKNLIFLARFSHSKERDLSLSYIVAHLQSLLAREHNLNQHKSRIWQALTTIDDSMLRISCSLVSLFRGSNAMQSRDFDTKFKR